MLSIRTTCTAAIFTILGLTLVLGAGCPLFPPADIEILQVTPAEAQALIQEHLDDANFVILDVRTPGEFASGHIAGAVNVSYDVTNPQTFTDAVVSLDKTKTYFVYCGSEHRSPLAEAVMKQQGFTHLYNLTGGLNRWKAEGLPVVQ